MRSISDEDLTTRPICTSLEHRLHVLVCVDRYCMKQTIRRTTYTLSTYAIVKESLSDVGNYMQELGLTSSNALPQ